ncbi:hypothetical protein ABTD81_09460 [Acinetobacter baumannii]
MSFVNTAKYLVVHEGEIDFTDEIKPHHGDRVFERSVVKRLVESLDIINDLGGIEKLTPYFITTDKHVGYTHVLKHFSGALRWLDEYWDSIPEQAISIKRVMTAIRDHESIYGGGDV